MIKQQGHMTELTEKQKECLRLVSRNFSSKQIARQLGISPYAVDQRVRFAVKSLNAQDRFEAARVFTSNDPSRETYEPLAYHPSHVEQSLHPDTQNASGAFRDHAFDTHESTLRDAGAAVWPTGPAASLWDTQQVFESRGFQAPLSWKAKAALAVGVAMFSLVAFAAGISGLEVLSRLN
jgi:DNA-binding CsgD family transcriptional regulator